MRTLLKENLLAQFSLVAVAIMFTVGVVITTTSGSMLNTIMADHAAMMSTPSGQASIREDIYTFRWLNLGILAASFMALYGGLVFLIWRGSRRFLKERSRMGAFNRELERQIHELAVEEVAVTEIARIVTSTLRIEEV